jgi:Reverse transcriptase (RNA-dependent DNA polymerase)
MATLKGTLAFYNEDFMRTLFPLETNQFLIGHAAEHVGGYVREILSGKQAFSSQTRVYAAKPQFHFRRTVKLDVAAEFYLYDLVYRNRRSFRNVETSTRRNFGYQFSDGELVSSSLAFQAFRTAVREASTEFSFGASFDVSAYFNSIYQHDLVKWFNRDGRSDDDVSGFGKFLRETTAGRSIDCLPQGLAPAKIIGSHFLDFLDFAVRLKNPRMLRFMDDVAIFARDSNTIIQDFFQIQKLLGEKGLSVNPAKTRIGNIAELDVRREIDQIKKSLLQVRRQIMIDDYGEETEVVRVAEQTLSSKQKEYLLELLRDPQIDEEDAELVLTLLREQSEDVLEHVRTFLEKFPNLAKTVYFFCEYVGNRERLAEELLNFIQKGVLITEYQLFWLAWIAQSCLSKCGTYGTILMRLYEHPSASLISRAKILEIPEKRFGFNDLREEHLRSGQSDWLSWASAVGIRCEKKANRNHLLGYFGKSSPLNQLISDCVKSL